MKKVKFVDRRDLDYYNPRDFIPTYYAMLDKQDKENLAWWFDDAKYDDFFYYPKGVDISSKRTRILKPDAHLKTDIHIATNFAERICDRLESCQENFDFEYTRVVDRLDRVKTYLQEYRDTIEGDVHTYASLQKTESEIEAYRKEKEQSLKEYIEEIEVLTKNLAELDKIYEQYKVE